MVIVEQTMPITIGSKPIPSVEPATSEIRQAKVPTIIELMAPTLLAIFHHAAQIYAGRKADRSPDVAKPSMSKTPGGTTTGSARAMTASRTILARETFTEVRSLIFRWMER